MSKWLCKINLADSTPSLNFLTHLFRIIEVPDEVIKSLDRVGKLQKQSRAAVIREAIAEYLSHKSLPAAETAFGLWKEKPKDSLDYQDQLRAEWDNP